MPADQSSTDPGNSKETLDQNIQIKFTIIFGLLALIPFVLFYYYGIDSKPDAPGKKQTNSIPEAKFKEITESAGINFRHVNGAQGEKLLPETMGGGCAFFDFDNDGNQDLVFTNSTS